MARPRIIFTDTQTGRRSHNLGDIVSHGFERVINRFSGIASRNIGRFINLTADVWIDIVQRTTWADPRPADRSTIIAQTDIGKGEVVYGWHDFKDGATSARARFRARKTIMDEALISMLSDYNFGVGGERQFFQAEKAYRKAFRVARSHEVASYDYIADIKRFAKINMLGGMLGSR